MVTAPAQRPHKSEQCEVSELEYVGVSKHNGSDDIFVAHGGGDHGVGKGFQSKR